jgi:SAM-dependent methyltransferase
MWHSNMIRWDNGYQALRFMNYGYAPLDDMEPIVDDTAHDEPYGAALYHVAVSHTQVKGARILEVSSGRGGGAAYIAQTFTPREYVGLDVSNQNVEACSKVYADIDNLRFVEGTAEALPFADASFDAVVNVEASRAYGDLDAFLKEVRRVLRPDGSFLLTDMRYADDVENLRTRLANAGFSMVAHLDISDNVVRALERDNQRKVDLMRRRVPRMFLSAFSEFAGTVGSKRYEAFRDGSLKYFSWFLRPQPGAATIGTP